MTEPRLSNTHKKLIISISRKYNNTPQEVIDGALRIVGSLAIIPNEDATRIVSELATLSKKTSE